MNWTMQTARCKWAAEQGGGSGAGGPRMTRPLVPGIPSRVVDPSGVVKRQERTGSQPVEPEPAVPPRGSEGQLVVGSGIQFKGEINACDTLVVHGQVEASLPARAIRVAEDGNYQGTAEVDEAEIAGDFDGTLTVRRRLTIMATGRVKGTIRYAELEVAAGGQMTGDIQLLEQTASAAETTSPSKANAEKAAQSEAGKTAPEDTGKTAQSSSEKSKKAAVSERLREAVPELAESEGSTSTKAS